MDNGYGGDGYVSSQYLRSGTVPDQSSGGEGKKNTESEGEKQEEKDKGDSQNESASEGGSGKENSKEDAGKKGNTDKEKRHSEILTNRKETINLSELFHQPSADRKDQRNEKRETTVSQEEKKGFFEKAIEAVNRLLERNRRSFNYRNFKGHTSNEGMEQEVARLNTGKRDANGHNHADHRLSEGLSNANKRHVEASRGVTMERLLRQRVKRSSPKISDRLYDNFMTTVDRLLPTAMGKRSAEESSGSVTATKDNRAGKESSELTLYDRIMSAIDRFLPTIVNKRSAEESPLFENLLIKVAERLLSKVDKRSAEENSAKEPTLYETFMSAVNRLLPKDKSKRSAEESSSILEKFLINMAERILSEVDKRSAEESSENERTLYERLMTTVNRIMPMIMSKRSVEESSSAEGASVENQQFSGEIDRKVKPVTRLDLYNRILNDRLKETDQ